MTFSGKSHKTFLLNTFSGYVYIQLKCSNCRAKKMSQKLHKELNDCYWKKSRA